MPTTIETVAGSVNTMVLNMGPQHPSTHGVLRVVLELDGEIVLKARPVIGYLHTGIEKNMEAKTYSQAITMTDRIDYLAPLSNNLCYCLAVEKILGIEIPKRAQYIRVLLTEMTRIASHLVWLGTHAIDLGAMSVFLYTFREREEIMKIFEYVSGQRMMTSYFRIGGIALEPPPNWLIAFGSVAPRAWESSAPKMPSPWALRAPCCAAAACLTTSARLFPTRAMKSLTSIFKRKPRATASHAIRFASPKFAKASKSSARPWKKSLRKGPSRPPLPELLPRPAKK
jgi:hypothetical protein